MADLLEMHGIGKSFGGVVALNDVDFDLQRGEVHAIVGENGAGKSTLIKILSGVHSPDSGYLLIDGERTSIRDPRHAQELGTATIYQEGSLYPDLSVLENLFIGHQPRTRMGLLDWATMRKLGDEVFERLQVRIPLTRQARELSRAQAKLIEIARALLRNARVIVMDEPTAALPADDVERLFQIVKGLRSQNVSVIYISHRLEEVFRLAQRVTVLRDGRQVGSEEVGNIDYDWLINRMVGRELSELYPRNIRTPGKPVLEVETLSRAGVFEDVSFTVHEGEVVGMAGLVGSGRSEVARAVFGIDSFDRGSVSLGGEPMASDPRRAIDMGCALLPEDRTHQGLVLPFSVAENTSLAVLGQVSRAGFLLDGEERTLASGYIDKLSIRAPGPSATTDELSGGNQQKVVLSKWLASRPKVLILDEPTQGVDVGAKAEIHRLVDELVQEGVAVLLISSDLEEVLGMADRILVMHRGRLAAELPRGASAEDVMRHATGLPSGVERMEAGYVR